MTGRNIQQYQRTNFYPTKKLAMRCHECERNRKERRKSVSLALAEKRGISSTVKGRVSKKGFGQGYKLFY